MARAAATYPQNKEASNGQEKCARRSNYKVSNDLSSVIIFPPNFQPKAMTQIGATKGEANDEMERPSG